MSVIIKSAEMSYKDPVSGDYIGINTVAEKKTSEALADIADARSGALTDISNAGDAELLDIQNKGQQVIDNIPADYSDLQDMIVDEYDQTKIADYTIGTYVRHNDGTHDYIYRCIIDPSEDTSWTAGHWEKIILANDFQNELSYFKWENNTIEIDGYTKTYNSTDIKTGKTTGAYINRANGSVTVSSWNYYTINVTAGWFVKIKTFTNTGAPAFIICKSDNSVIYTYPENSTSGLIIDKLIKIPLGASYIRVNENPIQLSAEIYHIENPVFLKSGDSNSGITLVKNGHAYQIRSKLEKTEKYISINFTDNGSSNGGFSFGRYDTLDSLPQDPLSIVSGTQYKGSGDDICPIHYNGSYRGGNHGKHPTFKISSTGHGKTEVDIGSVWKSNNNHNYVIYRIDDENSFSIIGDLTNDRNNVEIRTPTTPLAHVSGATHTGSVSFTSASSVQMLPTFKNYLFKLTDSFSNEIVNDGAYFDNNYFQIDEKYECFDITDLVTKLKTNVGNNSNSSYYSNTIDADLLIQNSYKIFSNGSCVVACAAIPLKSGVYVEYWGGVQSGAIGPDCYAPFTVYDTIQTQGSSSIELPVSNWRSSDFPAYKMYQFSENNGFAVGYAIDYGQGIPSIRKDKLAGGSGAGFWYGSSHKMYPHFYDFSLENAPDLYNNSLSFYAFRAPVIKDNNTAIIWYEIEDSAYIEIELFAQKNMLVELPSKFYGRKIDIIKATDSISLLTDIVGAFGIYITSTGAASATIKLTK